MRRYYEIGGAFLLGFVAAFLLQPRKPLSFDEFLDKADAAGFRVITEGARKGVCFISQYNLRPDDIEQPLGRTKASKVWERAIMVISDKAAQAFYKIEDMAPHIEKRGMVVLLGTRELIEQIP